MEEVPKGEAEVFGPSAFEKKAFQKVSQEQIHGLLFSDKLSWQAILLDLVNTEQLDPWDIDLSLLSKKFLERIHHLEEMNFFISSKVLLAAAILLRMKSDILLECDLPGLDEILFGRKDEKKYTQERIELDEDIPHLIMRTPLPRYKRVTLQELMDALGKAIKTETRRIKKIVVAKQQEIETSYSIPRQRINLQEKIKEVYSKLLVIFSQRDSKLPFKELAGERTEDRIATFIPLLHLDNQQKVWLEQEGHCQEIWILLKTLYEKQNADLLEQLRKEVALEFQILDGSEGENSIPLKNDFVNSLEEGVEDISADFEDSKNLSSLDTLRSNLEEEE